MWVVTLTTVMLQSNFQGAPAIPDSPTKRDPPEGWLTRKPTAGHSQAQDDVDPDAEVRPAGDKTVLQVTLDSDDDLHQDTAGSDVCSLMKWLLSSFLTSFSPAGSLLGS